MDIVYRQKIRDLNHRAKLSGSKGRLNAGDLYAVLEFYGAHCLVPGCTNTDVTFDHVIPLEKQGANARRNLQLLCESHNKARQEVDYREGRICPDEYVAAVNKPISSEYSNLSRRGGKREGAGRKPLEYTLLKRRMQQEKMGDAEKAFDLYVQIMENPNEETGLRMAAADRVLDRTIGKPAQVQPSVGEELYKLYTERMKAFVFDGKPMGQAGTDQERESTGSWLRSLAASGSDTLVA